MKTFYCDHCGSLLFFENVQCVKCGHALGFLPDVLDLLKKKGFKLVTLEEAESDPAYQSDPDAGLHDAGTLLDQLMMVKQIKNPAVVEKPYKELQEICQ